MWGHRSRDSQHELQSVALNKEPSGLLVLSHSAQQTLIEMDVVGKLVNFYVFHSVRNVNEHCFNWQCPESKL